VLVLPIAQPIGWVRQPDPGGEPTMIDMTDPAGQRTSPDGRVALDDEGIMATDTGYCTVDLAPVPIGQRRWGRYTYAALWIGMAHNVSTYLLAGGLIELGMSWPQALLTVGLANLLVLVPMLLLSHAGTRYGIPFPVLARAVYGLRGAHVVTVLRALIACAWFGVQTWIGGEAMFALVGRLAGPGWSAAIPLWGRPWTAWLCFVVFWVAQLLIVAPGMRALRRFESWAAPFVLVMIVLVAGYLVVHVGGTGPVLADVGGGLGWGGAFWAVFAPALMAMIGFWSTMALNMADFTRYARGQGDQAAGQLIGLPATMVLVAFLSVLITSAGALVFGGVIWDPVELIARLGGGPVVVVGLVTIVVATASVNVAANVIAPVYALCNLLPRYVTFRRAVLITGVVGVLGQPWRLLDSNGAPAYQWLTFAGGLLGAVAGVLIGGYWIRARTRLVLAELYRADGRYWFSGGVNWRAMLATAAGMLLAVGGAYSPGGEGPFPAAGLIPPLRPLYDYSWLISLGVALSVYLLLTRPGRDRELLLSTSAHTTGSRPRAA
jgi:NCS1 family nucleobase:cation symporter-1